MLNVNKKRFADVNKTFYFAESTETVSTATLTESAFKESQVSLQSLWSQAFLVSQEVIANEANTAKIKIKFFIRVFLKINV